MGRSTLAWGTRAHCMLAAQYVPAQALQRNLHCSSGIMDLACGINGDDGMHDNLYI